jgi:ubiquinone/menaquinone biosynthesis C-methylase UbiE
MHPRIHQEFERICAQRKIRGSVLEIGALPADSTLLNMKSLENVSEKIGINLSGPHKYKDIDIIKGNANSMTCFESDRFDVVLCNAVLEHDKFFWKTIGEIKRVTKSGGFIVISTPGYTHYKIEKAKQMIRRIPVLRRLVYRYLNVLNSSTITFEIHDAPGDYYRFSEQAYQQVFFEGLSKVEVISIMTPPRIIGCGVKP